MRVLAVTGGIGSGKSEVCRILAGHGMRLQYNADARAKALYTECPGLLDAIEDALGCVLRAEDGTFIPSALAAVIFTDKGAIKGQICQLNSQNCGCSERNFYGSFVFYFFDSAFGGSIGSFRLLGFARIAACKHACKHSKR